MNILRNKEAEAIDKEIARLITTLSGMSSTQDEYATVVDNLKVLCDAREKKNHAILNPETLINVAANLMGLLLILNFERTGVITSRAISFLWKGKS